MFEHIWTCLTTSEHVWYHLMHFNESVLCTSEHVCIFEHILTSLAYLNKFKTCTDMFKLQWNMYHECVQMWSQMFSCLKHVQMWSNMFKCVHVQCVYGYAQMWTDMFRCVPMCSTCSNTFKCVQTCLDIFKFLDFRHAQPCSDIFKGKLFRCIQ